MKTAYFQLDHFGIAGDSVMRDLLDQSTNKRTRKVAFNNYVRLMKAAKAIARDASVDGISLLVMPLGSICIMVEYSSPSEETIASFINKELTHEEPNLTP